MRNKIQIVDDNVALTTLLAKTLSKFGYETVVQNDPVQALNTARYEVPSLILLDVMMPGRDGGEVLNDLRNDPSLRYIPVILLTAIAREAQGLANTGGITSKVLSKPVQLMELLSTIENELTSSFSYTEEQEMIDMGPPGSNASPFQQQPVQQQPSPFAPQDQVTNPPFSQSEPTPFPQSSPAPFPQEQPPESDPPVRNITPGGYTEAPGEPPFPQSHSEPTQSGPTQPAQQAQTQSPFANQSQLQDALAPSQQTAHSVPPSTGHPQHAHQPTTMPPPPVTNLFQFPKRENPRENVNPW